jgi:hypothetical protein
MLTLKSLVSYGEMEDRLREERARILLQLNEKTSFEWEFGNKRHTRTAGERGICLLCRAEENDLCVIFTLRKSKYDETN